MLISCTDSGGIGTNDENKAPTARISKVNQLYNIGDIVSLSGKLSSDPESDALTYLWTIESAPPDSDMIIKDPHSPEIQLIPDTDEEYRISLTVSDGNEDDLRDETMSRTSVTFSVAFESNVKKDWTFMFYFNCSDLEGDVMRYIAQLVQSVNNDEYVNIVILLDKVSSSNFGIGNCGFEDTRLFTITYEKGLIRIGGGEALPTISKSSDCDLNMGDACTLKGFIELCKTRYPAEKFFLTIDCHGAGIGGLSHDIESGGDRLHVGEISSLLNSSHSVDVLFLDACQMGNLETIYQFRKSDSNSDGFSADYILASPMTVIPSVWNYTEIFIRIDPKIDIEEGTIDTAETDTVSGGILEKKYHPAVLSSLELSRIIVEESYDSAKARKNNLEYAMTLSCYDMSKVEMVKEKMDLLVYSLVADVEGTTKYKGSIENIRDAVDVIDGDEYYRYMSPYDPFVSTNTIVLYPLYELYDLCYAVKNYEDPDEFSSGIKETAEDLQVSLDDLIPFSHLFEVSYNENGNPDVKNLSGKAGLSFFFPHGDKPFIDGEAMFYYQWWYNALNVSSFTVTSSSESFDNSGLFGAFHFCRDGAIPDNGIVENWFELLDAWYDNGPEETGGWNGYSY